MNITVFFVTNYQTLRTFQSKNDKDQPDCPEDKFADDITKVLTFEIIFRIVYLLYWHFHWLIKSKII